ncbi:MAG: DUF3363 domain-containing protein [Caulobacteraceae bacterium]
MKLAGSGEGPAAHLKYLGRDGVTQDGERGELYGPGEGPANGRAFLERTQGDPHQFRFIVSVEDGADLADLRAFTRDLMGEVERDLGVPLDWVAVDHFNTAHPHSHIVLRGRDQAGGPLFIAGDYIAHGIRQRASEFVTLELGPETKAELRRKLEAETQQERFTRLDRAMLKEARDGTLEFSAADRPPLSALDRRLRLGRLKTLERLGLAEPQSGGRWRLRPGAEAALRRLGERAETFAAIRQALLERGLERPAEALVLHREQLDAPVVGRLIGKHLTDELGERLSLIVDGVDGRVHHLRGGMDADAISRGDLIEVQSAGGARPADRAVAALAREAGGVYRPSVHLTEVETSGRLTGAEAKGYVEAHVRRLEALRRAGVSQRLGQDEWRVPEDFEARAGAYDARRGVANAVRVLSRLDLEAQIEAKGATWLDRQLVGAGRVFLAPTGFGIEVGAALEARRDLLIAQGDADPSPRGVRYRAGLLAELERRELAEAGAKLGKVNRPPFRPASDGEAIRGVFKERVNLVSGDYALIERAQDFTLVPWRPVIEPFRGQSVAGLMQGASISWRLGRQRGLGL